MNSAEEEMEAAMWSALTRHKVTCLYADELMKELVVAAKSYAATADTESLTEARRTVLFEATAPRMWPETIPERSHADA